MDLRKYWREVYLTVMIAAALAVIAAAAYFFSNVQGLGITAVGVFIAVLGVGLYDEWHGAERVRVENKRRR